MKISLIQEQVLDLESSLKKEYLLTNGLGGYSSSTLLDCHRRKYHGLLIAPHGDKRYNFLSKLETSITFEKKDCRLSTNKFPGVYHPTGHKYIESIEYELFPLTRYRIGDIRLEKSLLMVPDENTILIKYDVLESAKRVTLKASPFIAYREIHEIMTENIHIHQRAFVEKNGFRIEPYEGMPPLFLHASRTSVFYPSPAWWRSFEYMKERNRGYPYQEDLFCPGIFEVHLKAGESVIFRASLSPVTDIKKQWQISLKYAQKEALCFEKEPEPLKTLKTSARQYVYKNENGEGILAGFHWFDEWGRDTFISMAGLTLCTGKEKTAFNILKKFSAMLQNGLLPNIIDHGQGKAFNSVDASLQFIRAVQLYLEKTRDRKNVETHLFPAMQSIILAYFNGTVPFARLMEEGFIYAGTPDTQLTWMDAKSNGRPVTPRYGAPVEITALWYNALCFLKNDFSGIIDNDLLTMLEHQITRIEENFEKRYWHAETNCLADVYRSGNDIDTEIRPNQLYAAALPYSCLSLEKCAAVVETVTKHLVTPYGLRTLSPQSPYYIAEYKGSQDQRDAAYHQGIVWPWLIGIFTEAMLKTNKDKQAVREYIEATFHHLWKTHLENYGCLHISEIFKPNPPHTAKGCIAQAWSIAEVIRTLELIKGCAKCF